MYEQQDCVGVICSGTVPHCNCLNDGQFQTISLCVNIDEDHSDDVVPAADRCNTLITHMNSLSTKNAFPFVFRSLLHHQYAATFMRVKSQM